MEQTIRSIDAYYASSVIAEINLSLLRAESIAYQINGWDTDIINSQYEATVLVIEALNSVNYTKYRAIKSFYMEDKNA